MAPALHGCAKLRRFFPPQRVVEFGEERRDWVSNKSSISRSHKLRSSMIGEIDSAVFIDGYNCGRAGFDQSPQSFPPLQGQLPVTHQLGHEQPAAHERLRLKSQTNHRPVK